MTVAPAPQNSARRHILVSSALPYANGSLHAGHILEHTQTDIWVRFQRLRGHTCTYVSADDGHGTTTMLKAEELGLTPEELLRRVREEHIRDFEHFNIEHDNYYSTHSEENRELSELIYGRCLQAGQIHTRQVEQLYDEEKGLFLADRFVCGACPKCKAEDQYGDNCEVCGATYNATELLNPVSRLSGATPVLKTSEHFFFNLPAFTDFLKDWIKSDAIHESIRNKLEEWLITGLAQWDISRDSPYFGFRIPDTTDKYFYVWLDAPIGYMASFQNLAERRDDLDFSAYWDEEDAKSANTEVHHFIGKDIIYFHALFWPAMLKCAGFRVPTRIHTHGFLTIGKDKMSKSRNINLDINYYLKHFDPEYLRYYFASRLTPGIDDIDMDMNHFAQKVNSDLVGKVVNIASRCAKFISGQFDGKLGNVLPDPEGFQYAVDCGKTIAEHFENDDFARAIREIMLLADRTNEYIQAQAPWVLAREGGAETATKVQAVCTQGLNLFRLLVLYLKPVIPAMAARAESFLRIQPMTWGDLGTALLDHHIDEFEPLLKRIDLKALAPLVAPTQAATDKLPEKKMIDYEEFAKVDLRVARILQAEEVAGADRLLKLKLDLGGTTREVFAGIKNAYSPAELNGRLTIVVANLQPKKMRFGISEGMVLAAGEGEDEIFLLAPDTGARPGMVVK